MKECPECLKTFPDNVMFCDCGYEFPVFVGDVSGTATSEPLRGRRMSNDTLDGKWNPVILFLEALFLCIIVYLLLPNPECYDEEWCVNGKFVFGIFCVLPTVLAGATLSIAWLIHDALKKPFEK